MLDIKITGGQVIDGTGAPARRADVGLTGDRITTVGDLSAEPAGRTIDAAGRTVTPGFIDMHSHSDWRLWDNRRAESKIRQGVTTEVVGNCGFSPAPVSDAFRQEMKGFALYLPEGMDFSWRTVGDYLARYEDDGVAVNVVQLIGHGTLRPAALTWLIRVGREGGLPTQVSHVKAAGRPNWGKVADALALIDAARSEGLDVMGDVYPYTASSTSLRTLLPDWVLEGGVDAMVKRLADPSVVARVRRELMGGGETLLRGLEWSDIMVSYAPSRPDAQGRRIAEIAAAWQRDPLDAVIDLIVAEHGKGSMILFQLDEADLRRALTHPHVMVGSEDRKSVV